MKLTFETEDDLRKMSIGRVSKLLSIEPSKIRFWESRDLLNLARDAQDYRMFDCKVMGRLLDIAHLRKVHIPIAKVPDYFNSSYLSRRSLV